MAINRKLKIANQFLSDVLDGNAYMLLEGGMGTSIQARKLHEIHQIPDLLNITHPHEISAIQKLFVEAGSDCITASTFNSNRVKLKDSGYTVEQVFKAAVQNARNAGAKLVAADIGPIGSLLKPLGSLSFEDAYSIFSEQAKAAESSECDLILIETMTDLLETKTAVLAAVENTDLPVFATMTFGEDGRTFLGTTPEIAASTISAIGASATGVNCSLGPKEIAPLIRRLAPNDRTLIMAQPNAGLPQIINGDTVYEVTPKDFADCMKDVLDAGATVIGGCCGTTPEHIAVLRELIDSRPAPLKSHYRQAFTVTSAQEMVSLPKNKAHVAVIGERINPTGKMKLKDALESGDLDYIIGEAVMQQRAGADILDVNVGVAGIDEIATLKDTVFALQSTITAPLQIDSSDPDAIEACARKYSGRPMINSVNGKAESLQSVLPIVAHYGCTVVGLTLDENGIPQTAEERLVIAERIVESAQNHGIPLDDIAIDCLVMSAATNQNEINEILRAVSLVKERLGVRTVLGVSNVSFGLPARSLVNSTFLAAAFGAGLDMPILDPLNKRYSDTVSAFRVLNGQDAGCVEFIDKYSCAVDPYEVDKDVAPSATNSSSSIATRGNGQDGSVAVPIEITNTFTDMPEAISAISQFILDGRAEPVADITRELLEDHDGFAVINEIFVPILDLVGKKYDDGVFFLPQLMASAEAVKAGFDIVRAQSGSMAKNDSSKDRSIILATVQGDIHDIGKNIVKMLLENYGFDVIDLGKDVSPESIVASTAESGARLVGLSALMTTTVDSMQNTIEMLKERLPEVKVMVGGAVITEEFAKKIGADFYAKDAAASARIASGFFAE